MMRLVALSNCDFEAIVANVHDCVKEVESMNECYKKNQILNKLNAIKEILEKEETCYQYV